jgi:hypothetical protein
LRVSEKITVQAAKNSAANSCTEYRKKHTNYNYKLYNYKER